MIEKKYYTIKNGFGFSDKHLYLIEYNDFNKKIIRNYDKIRTCMVNDLSQRHHVEYTDFRHMDFLVDNELYLKMMLFLDINQIGYLSNFIDVNSGYQDKMYFICLNFISMQKSYLLLHKFFHLLSQHRELCR